ncbi:hypothetical protein GH733_019063 [Mirounga leonina]|nr:hypothetical protein GH733_019063 [Mirounga leonina]
MPLPNPPLKPWWPPIPGPLKHRRHSPFGVFSAKKLISQLFILIKLMPCHGATSIAGHFTPGNFTNQIQAAFRELRLPEVTLSQG